MPEPTENDIDRAQEAAYLLADNPIFWPVGEMVTALLTTLEEAERA